MPSSASIDSAQATSAAWTSIGASWTENASSACIGSVPLTSDRPSLGASCSGSIPCSASTSALGRPAGASPGPRSRPSPISGWARWASWARSPEAPTDPLPGNDREQAEARAARSRRRGRSGADARVARGQRPGPQQQHRAHGGVVERLPRCRPRASGRSRPAAGSGPAPRPGCRPARRTRCSPRRPGRRPRWRRPPRSGWAPSGRHAGPELGAGFARGATSMTSCTVRASPLTITVRMADSLPCPGQCCDAPVWVRISASTATASSTSRSLRLP